MSSSTDDDTRAIYGAGAPGAAGAATDLTGPGSASEGGSGGATPEPAGVGARAARRRGRQDPMAQLRALREQASDLARKTGTRTPGTGGAGASNGAAGTRGTAGAGAGGAGVAGVAGVTGVAAGLATAAAAAPAVAPPPAAPTAYGRPGAGPVGAPNAYQHPDPRFAQPAPRPQPGQPEPGRRAARVRKARLRLLRVDPWSVMKVSLLLSVAAGITLFVAVAVLWSILDAAGVFATLGDLVREVTASEVSRGINIEELVSLSRVLGFTTLIGVVDVVLITALATLGAFIYNLAASLLGGLEVTLAEDD